MPRGWRFAGLTRFVASYTTTDYAKALRNHRAEPAIIQRKRTRKEKIVARGLLNKKSGTEVSLFLCWGDEVVEVLVFHF